MALVDSLPVWITLLALGALVAVVVWANQREVRLEATEVRADQAETRAATAEAVVTVQAQSQLATATAFAYVNSPAATIDHDLALVLAAERDPNQDHLKALSDAFGPPALSMIRPEIEHLLSGGLHLGGDSGYQLNVVGTDMPAPDEAQLRTRERWVYDERNGDDERTRCLVEDSDQTYTLKRTGADWQIVDITLGTSSRSDCT